MSLPLKISCSIPFQLKIINPETGLNVSFHQNEEKLLARKYKHIGSLPLESIERGGQLWNGYGVDCFRDIYGRRNYLLRRIVFAVAAILAAVITVGGLFCCAQGRQLWHDLWKKVCSKYICVIGFKVEHFVSLDSLNDKLERIEKYVTEYENRSLTAENAELFRTGLEQAYRDFYTLAAECEFQSKPVSNDLLRISSRIGYLYAVHFEDFGSEYGRRMLALSLISKLSSYGLSPKFDPAKLTFLKETNQLEEVASWATENEDLSRWMRRITRHLDLREGDGSDLPIIEDLLPHTVQKIVENLGKIEAEQTADILFHLFLENINDPSLDKTKKPNVFEFLIPMNLVAELAFRLYERIDTKDSKFKMAQVLLSKIEIDRFKSEGYGSDSIMKTYQDINNLLKSEDSARVKILKIDMQINLAMKHENAKEAANLCRGALIDIRAFPDLDPICKLRLLHGCTGIYLKCLDTDVNFSDDIWNIHNEMALIMISENYNTEEHGQYILSRARYEISRGNLEIARQILETADIFCQKYPNNHSIRGQMLELREQCRKPEAVS